MHLEERAYSVLIASAAENFNAGLSSLLPCAKYTPALTVSSISAAKRAFAERAYDYIIINAPLPDGPGTRFAIDACNSANTVVLLLVRADLHAEIHDRVAQHGVFTLSRPISKHAMETALQWMESARERLRKFEKKSVSIEEKMEEIRIVNKAKWLLIRELKMDEPEAHRYIEKQAMDRCVTRREIAAEIIKLYSQ